MGECGRSLRTSHSPSQLEAALGGQARPDLLDQLVDLTGAELRVGQQVGRGHLHELVVVPVGFGDELVDETRGMPRHEVGLGKRCIAHQVDVVRVVDRDALRAEVRNLHRQSAACAEHKDEQLQSIAECDRALRDDVAGPHADAPSVLPDYQLKAHESSLVVVG